LKEATRATGRVGPAAQELAKVLHPHFVREEEIALPPLGLLSRLASGDFTADMADVLSMTDALKRELPQMLEEHKAIRAAVENLRVAAPTTWKSTSDSPTTWRSMRKRRRSCSIRRPSSSATSFALDSARHSRDLTSGIE
jgi:hypothetical protein